MPSAVVVGGGVAGLVLARELAIGGLEVTLLEASDRLGGKVARHQVAGIALDAGAESFATRRGTVAALAAELGLEPVLPDPAGAWLQSAAGSVPLPKTGLLGIPAVPLAADVIAVVGLRSALRAQLDGLMIGTIGAKEQNLGRLVRRRMGRGVLEKLVAPVVIGIHSRHPDELEVDTVAPGLRAALLSRGSLAHAVGTLRAAAPAGSAVAGFTGGIYELVEALAADLEARGVRVRTSARVVASAEKSVTLEGGEVVGGDHVVLATPLEGAGGASITLATLVVDAAELDHAPRGTGVLVAPGTPGVSAKALTHATAKWPWLAAIMPAHRHVLRLSYAGPAGPGDGLQALALADAGLLLGVPLVAGQVAGFARVEWMSAAAEPGSATVGETVSGTGLAAVISGAKQEAGRLLEALE